MKPQVQWIMLNRLLPGVILWFALSTAASAQTVIVAAAANLAAVLNGKLIPAFERTNPAQIRVVIGATKVLEQQMENGAPYDVFISADMETTKKLAIEGYLDKSSLTPYAVGQLVMWTRNDSKVHPTAILDLANPSILHIAVANPKIAPYGAATIDALTKAGLFTACQPKIVYAENIQQSLEFAATGNADVSFTALSLVINRSDGFYSVVPEFLYDPIVQSLGVKSGASTAARSFAAFLVSRDADSVWTTSGYRLPQR